MVLRDFIFIYMMAHISFLSTYLGPWDFIFIYISVDKISFLFIYGSIKFHNYFYERPLDFIFI